jgi:aspartyl/asparaginyl beta-hydroxylase (cupin superfamily)
VTDPTPEDSQVEALLAAADRAGAAGQQQMSAELLHQAESLAPEHPLVLNVRGMRALQSRDAKLARELFQRAVERGLSTPTAWLNLAMACRASKDAEAELQALDHALNLDPYFFLALLQKATLLERLGRHTQAASVFQAFLVCVPESARQSPGMQTALAHARRVIDARGTQLEAVLRTRMADARSRWPLPQQRVDHCLDVLLGRQRVYVQQPTFLHFPFLPAIQFHDRAAFPWLEAVEAATDAISLEFEQLLVGGLDGFVPYISHPPGAPLNQWQELNHSRRWSALHLWRDGNALQEPLARCPNTAAVLASLPLANIPAHAPTAFFSVLEPHTRIPPHTGVTNVRLVTHLPLRIPPGCAFRVGSETREWQRGRAWVFDDTIEHEAWNHSAEPRAILIFDIWNPYLSEAERELVSLAIEAVGEFNAGNGPAFSAL